MLVTLAAMALAGPADPALAWTGAALGAGGLTVELWALEQDHPTWFAIGLGAEIAGLPLLAGSGLDRTRRAGGAGVALAPGLFGLGMWGAGCGVKAVWRTRGPDALGPVTLGMFGVAYGAAAAQWAIPPRVSWTATPSGLTVAGRW